MNEKTKKAIKGCKAAAVFLWIGCGGSAITGFIGLMVAFAMGNLATLFTTILAGGMAYLDGWMAFSINQVIRYIEHNGEDQGDGQEDGRKEIAENPQEKLDKDVQ